MTSFYRDFWRAVKSVSPADHQDLQPGYFVHRNTGYRGLIEALRGNFPSVASFLEEQRFMDVAYRFCRSFPPKDSRLFLYGGSFPEYLAVIESPELLCACARLDRAVMHAHVAADERPLHLKQLLQERGEAASEVSLSLVQAADVVLGPPPSASVDFLKTWSQLSGREVESSSSNPAPRGAALVTRPDDAVLVTPIDRAAVVLLRCLRKGLNLHGASIKALEAHPESNLQSTIAALFGAGAFVYLKKS